MLNPRLTKPKYILYQILVHCASMTHPVFHSHELVSHIESYLMFTAERNVSVRCNRALNFISKIENSCVWMIHFCVHMLLCANNDFSAFSKLFRQGTPFTLVFDSSWWICVCPHLIKPESLYKYLQWLGFYDISLGIHAPQVGSEMRLTFKIGEQRQGNRAWIPKCASTISLYASAHPDDLEEGYAKNNPLFKVLHTLGAPGMEGEEFYKYPVFSRFHDEKFMSSTDKPFNLCCRLSEVLTKNYVANTGICPLLELYSALLLDNTWLGMFAFVFYEHTTYGSMFQLEETYKSIIFFMDKECWDYETRDHRFHVKWDYHISIDGELVNSDMPPFIGLFRESMMHINIKNLNPRAWLFAACIREFPILDRVIETNQEMADEMEGKCMQVHDHFLEKLDGAVQDRIRHDICCGKGIIPRTTVLRTKIRSDMPWGDNSYWTRLDTKGYMVSVLGYAFPKCLCPSTLFYDMQESEIDETKLTNFHYQGRPLRYFDVNSYKIHPGVFYALGSGNWDRYPLPQQNNIAMHNRISTEHLEDHLVLYGCTIYKYVWNQPGKNDLFVYTNTNRGLKGYQYFDENALQTPPSSPLSEATSPLVEGPSYAAIPDPPRLVRRAAMEFDNEYARNVRRRLLERDREEIIDLTRTTPTESRTRSGRIYNMEVLMPSLPPSDLLDF